MTDAATSNALPSVVALRRRFHARPELGFLEYGIAAEAASTLTALGWHVQAGPEVMRREAMLGVPGAEAIAAARARALAEGADPAWIARMPDGMTGVVGTLDRGPGPVVALRFDIDALPIEEADALAHPPAAAGFGSAHPGRMHACGHDGHAAIGLEVARLLTAAEWTGRVLLIFQPAEEGGRGALPMVEAGVAAEATHFYAAHLGLGLPSGVVAAEARGFLGSAKIDAVFEGRAAHAGAAPQDGRHAILAAAHAVGALQALPRHGAELTQVNVGRIEGGSGRNVIPDRCRIEFEVRAETEPTLDALHARALAALEGAAALAGCAVRTELMGRTASFLSSPEAAARVARVAAAQGTEVRDVHHVGGGEDAAFFVRAAQARGGEAGYFILGADLADGHHSPRFDFDEAALVPGAALFAALALDALSGAPA